MSCSLGAKEVSYSIAGETLFEHLNFNLKHKEKVAIVGKNGCGKSTLLKIFAGLKMPSSGHIEIFHDVCRTLNDFKKHREKIGYVFQDPNDQFIASSVLEDVAFGLLNKGIGKEEAKTKAFEKLKMFNIDHLADKVPMHLSGGEKRLVALAGVLILRPEILLLDEPNNDLDEQTQERIVDFINTIDSSVVIVSHDQDFIRRVNANVLKLSKEGLADP